ncbi:hypothetical protein POTOM_040478 [Populus tomentosa]|uniref:MYB-like transcription factor ETC1 n=1 Tax=Populus tomentosa TaxID=118781 RepID=A0A8X8CHC5_POPTO|nr:hypothetical protein POTOM_040478 [Populus tomentosa]
MPQIITKEQGIQVPAAPAGYQSGDAVHVLSFTSIASSLQSYWQLRNLQSISSFSLWLILNILLLMKLLCFREETSQESSQESRLEFSEDEETLIIRMFNLVGERWSLIAGRIPGRTAEEIEKYWNTRYSTSE